MADLGFHFGNIHTVVTCCKVLVFLSLCRDRNWVSQIYTLSKQVKSGKGKEMGKGVSRSRTLEENFNPKKTKSPHVNSPPYIIILPPAQASMFLF